MIPRPDQPQKIVRYSSEGCQEISSQVISEANVTLSVNGEEWLTFACTPTNLEELAVGFLYNEGFLKQAADISLVKPCDNGCNIDVWLNKTIERPKQWLRTSGCTGGVTSTKTDLAAKPVLTETPIFSAQNIMGAMEQMLEMQEIYREARGLHCSAISDGQAIRYLAEDIGRHNTLDKLAGMLLLKPEQLSNRLIITTGRISADMLQKSSLLGADVVISRSSPTSLSIEQAQKLGIALVGYARHSQFSIYTYPERFEFPKVRPRASENR